MFSNRIFSALRNTAISRNVTAFRSTPSGQFFWDTSRKLLIIASWVPAVVFFNENVGMVTFISGPSMYPYLNTNYNESQSKDACWVNKWKPAENLKRGMLVSFWSPAHPEVLAVKRVIALPGDKVVTRAPYPMPTVDIPCNHIWVEGDNKDGTKTLDSNYYGPISTSLVQGKITHVLWPWNSAGSIRWWEFKGRTKVVKGRGED
ncbi:Mitochondrial inner membrane protease subunit [Lachnellula occidentalis]|uniref:Mitochondrial inner membrane protease subunit 2 n=1 Tax=Lachnellula occidentalis TaxID=215460 RepID=A0A8H8RIG1_9HELO|nr:Mitochondrial inner membrane protease subunit [Lachnellula occidentalis]